MKLQHKYALSTFLLGTGFLVALTTVFYFQSRATALEHARALSETIVFENSNDINEIIRDETTEARSLVYTPFVIEAITESNDLYGSLSEEGRIIRIAELEQQWRDGDDAMVETYLTKPTSFFLTELKRIFAPYYANLILTDRYGTLVATSDRTDTFSYADEEWWKASNNGNAGRITINDHGYDENLDEYIISAIVPVRAGDSTGTIIGHLKINLLLHELIDSTIQVYQNLQGSDFLVARAGGLIIYDSLHHEHQYHATLSDLYGDIPALTDRGSLTTGTGSARSLFTYGIIPLTTGTQNISFTGDFDSDRQGATDSRWYVIHTQDIAMVLAGIRKTTITLIQIGMLFIFAMALLAVIAANSISHPVSRLIRYTRLIGQGNLDMVIPLNSKDEIGTLAHAFNQMTLNLRQTMISRDHLASEITQRQITEAALRDSESRFHDLYNSMSSGVVFYEPINGGEDFLIKDMNNSGQRLSLVNINEIQGKRVTEVFPGIVDIGLLDVFRRVNETGEPEELPLKQYRDERLTEWVENYVFKLNSGEVVAVYDDITQRKVAELQFERIFNLSLDLICIVDFSGYFRKVNAAAMSMLGYSEKELLETPLRDLLHPDDVESTERIMNERILRGEPAIQFESRYRRKDGQYIWLSWIFQPILSEKRMYAIARDITEQKRVEEEIRKLARFPEENSNPVMRIDKSGTIIYANKACDALLRYWSCAAGGSAPDTLFIAVERTLNKNVAQSINTTIDGLTYKLSLVPVPDAGFVNLYGMDITDRILAEQALRESEEKFRLISEQSLMGIMILQGNEIQYANDAMGNIYELDMALPENRTLETMQTLIHPDDVDLFVEQALKKQRGENTGIVSDYTYRLQMPENRLKWVEIRSKTIRYNNKPADLLTCIDVTERKNIEQQMFQSQKMESVGRLAGGIAHDFNNLLTAIIGNVELAMDEVDPESSSAEDLAEIKHTAERAAVLTKKLLAFSRRQITEPKIININDVIVDMDKIFRRLISEHIELKSIPGNTLWNIRIDPGQLEQVIINLVVNARDAIEGSGKITIETQNVILDKTYLHDHPWAETGEFVMLAVSDTGIGMDGTVKAQIFEPFFTTKSKEKGTGLGLSTCYGIIRQNGGSIGVYSEPGMGTTMKVYLPRRVDAAIEQTVAPVIATETGGTETILVVEDESSVRKMISRILTSRGYQVIEASNGREALDSLDEQPRSIDLLVTDVVMPRMGGRELSEQLTARLPSIETLYISGYTENAIVHNGELDKNINFLHKPFSPFALTRKVREILDRRQSGTEDVNT